MIDYLCLQGHGGAYGAGAGGYGSPVSSANSAYVTPVENAFLTSIFLFSAAKFADNDYLAQSAGCAAECFYLTNLIILESTVRHTHADSQNEPVWANGVFQLLPFSKPSQV